MLSPDEFDDKYSDEQLREELPDRPLTSLRDIQYLYGRLYTLATAGGSEYAAYLTPDEARELFDEPESLIAVRVDLTGPSPRLATDNEGPLVVTSYRQELVEPVGHCKYDAARGIDHSITHRSGRDSDPEKLAKYAAQRLTKWATDEVVMETADQHIDGQFIQSLAELGEDEAVIETIKDTVETELGGPSTALLTVQIKVDGSGYKWPGEIEVFNEAMKQRKLSKLVSKNAADDSTGAATDLISGTQGKTVGMAEDPLNYFLGKQLEKFPGLDPDEAWRSHPLSEDAAVTIMNAQTFVESCTYPAFGASVYYLPYFLGSVEPEDVRILYDVLYDVVTEGEMTPVEYCYEKFAPEEIESQNSRLRFYVAAVMQHQMSRFDVYGETINGSLLTPWEIGYHHNEVVGSWVFNPNHEKNVASSPPLPVHDEWDLLEASSRRKFTRMVPKSGYFYNTLPDDSDDGDAAIEDLRIQALIASLGGQPITVEALISGYVDRLIEEQSDQFPSLVVSSQFAQLTALSAVPGVLEAETNDGETILQPPKTITTMQQDTPAATDGGTYVENRQRKLESFLEETPALTQNTQRRGAFLLGALVGAVGNYQSYSEGRSTTVIDQYPVDSVTEKRIKKITQEAIAKTLTYTRQEGRDTTLFSWIVDRLRETILDPDPSEWTLDTDDLRFYYALGVTYGMNDRSSDNNE